MKVYDKSFFQRYGLLIITGITFILTLIVNLNVRFYGDDFFYSRFTSSDLSYFLSRHKEHYLMANGRVSRH